jgi:predicted enzyme related to lactoylglutathione lyase
MIKRLDRLDVATADLDDAASIYQRNFGFKVTRAGTDSATVTIGGAEIRLAAGALAADALKAAGEGMFALWLEAEDLDQVVAAFKKAGLSAGTIDKQQGRRVLVIDPKIANQVPLYIFDRKG